MWFAVNIAIFHTTRLSAHVSELSISLFFSPLEGSKGKVTGIVDISGRDYTVYDIFMVI